MMQIFWWFTNKNLLNRQLKQLGLNLLWKYKRSESDIEWYVYWKIDALKKKKIELHKSIKKAVKNNTTTLKPFPIGQINTQHIW